ncbi:radical SAM/SPASM domain-containing protein [Azospirillum argentinense]|uniref:Radical SAM protein n=1 Tax=Azospirillum brasilense TaxID=192 RepID=A0A4D8QJS2_AZOBR|nr:radical SAM/SPASM domain-containing protein [Azospirillum argentinense]QCO07169.1 radical SAM protein [Azospirillum argentinense]
MSYTPINKGQFTLDTPERAAAFERARGHGCAEEYAENRLQWTNFPHEKRVADYPLHVDLELASICNLRCPMCYTISAHFRERVNARLMDFGLFTRLVDECAAGGVYSIRLSLRGEAFLHPRIVDCVRYAKQKGIREVSTLTNGIRLDGALFQELMEAGLDWITVSIDGVGPVYEKIRRPARFDDMVAKLTEFARLRREAGSVKPAIKVQSILPAIAEKPEEFYSIFAPITDLVSANPLIDFMQDKAELPKIPDFSCPQIYQRLVVGADGTCMMCANDESQEIVVGDANRQTLHEIWHGPEMTRIRGLHAQHEGCAALKPCANCYLPLATRSERVQLGERVVTAEKYVDGTESVAALDTPDRWRREGLNV